MKTVRTAHDALPGLLEIYAIPLYNIQRIYGSSVYILNHSDYYKIVCTFDSLQHDVKHIDSIGGTVYQHSIGGFIFGSNPYNEMLFEEMGRNNHILVIRKDDGTYKRIGDKETGLAFAFDFSTATPGMSFTFSGDLLHNSFPAELPFL
jgi:hypothetical protein